MKNLLFWFLCSITFNSFSQDFGTITKEEINYKDCPFDKEADRVIFFDKGISTHNEDQNLITKSWLKFKILKETGIDKTNLRIVYRSLNDYHKIEDLEAYVFNLDANGVGYKTIVDRKSIYIQKINEVYSEIKIALPEIKVGSIVEYRYTNTIRSYFGLQDWTFQSEMPVLFSQYDLTILPGLAFAYKIVKSRQLSIDIKNIKDQGRLIFEMRNIAGLRDEPFRDAPNDYRQQVKFQLAEYITDYGVRKKYANTWEELSRELLFDDRFGRAIDKNIRGSDEFLKTVMTKSNDYEKMMTVFWYVQKNFSWNGASFFGASDGLKKIWDKRSGSSGEINLLLINLMKELKLDVQPLLVSDRQHGKVDPTYPFVDQFNSVVALVMVNGKRYILDATDDITPPDMIPFDLLNTNAFLVTKKSTGVITLTDNFRTRKNFTGIQSTIDEDGLLKGEASVFSYDYSKLDRVTDYRKKGRKEFTSKYFIKEVDNIEIDSLDVLNIDSDSLPLEQKFHFTASMPASGDYRIVNMNLFGGMEKSPFVSDNRFTDINYGSQIIQSFTQVLHIPATMKPDVLPKSINLLMPDKSISLSRVVLYDAAKNSITSRVKFEVTRTVFVPEEYPSIKDFYKKMVELLNEPVVLKKK